MCAFWTYVGAVARLGNALGWSGDDGFYPVPVPVSLTMAWSFLMIFNFGAFFSPAAATSACDELLAEVRQAPPPPLRFCCPGCFSHGRARQVAELRSVSPVSGAAGDSPRVVRSNTQSKFIFEHLPRNESHLTRARACWTGDTGQPAAD